MRVADANLVYFKRLVNLEITAWTSPKRLIEQVALATKSQSAYNLLITRLSSAAVETIERYVSLH